MDKSENNIFGVPRPYSSTDLPTPGKVIKLLLKPVGILPFVIFTSVLLIVTSTVLYYIPNITYGTFGLSWTVITCLLAIILWIRNIEKSDIKQVPSIESVSNAGDYMKAATRLSFMTMGAIVLSTIAVICIHIIANSSINSITRLSVILSILFASLSSYIIVRTICSYTPFYQKTLSTIPVSISSLPEIVTIIGFIIPPSIVVYTGYIYDRPPILMVPWTISLFEMTTILVAILILYLSLVSRLKR